MRDVTRPFLRGSTLLGVLAMALLTLTQSCSVDEPRATQTAARATASPAGTASPDTPSATPSPAPPDPVAAAIQKAGRPSFGAVSPGGSALLVYNGVGRAGRGHGAFQLYAASGGVVAQGLLDRMTFDDYIRVYPLRHGFVVLEPDRRVAWRVTRNGRVFDVPMDGKPTRPAPGDVLLGGSGAYRPLSQSIYRRLLGPPGASITHADGHGVWWALGRPVNGQAVVWSATPGSPWRKHVVGEFSDTRNGCACDTDPGPLGRGVVIVVAGNPLSHVSLDYGRTWRTWDLGDTEPYRTVIEGNRFPQVSALPDGRIVIGYNTTGYWVGTDASNESFVQRTHYPKRELWRSGLTHELLHRPGAVSPDGGRTWVEYR